MGGGVGRGMATLSYIDLVYSVAMNLLTRRVAATAASVAEVLAPRHGRLPAGFTAEEAFPLIELAVKNAEFYAIIGGARHGIGRYTQCITKASRDMQQIERCNDGTVRDACDLLRRIKEKTGGMLPAFLQSQSVALQC